MTGCRLAGSRNGRGVDGFPDARAEPPGSRNLPPSMAGVAIDKIAGIL